MNIATLFSGIGSPEQAAKRVYPEHEVIFACEFDKFARQSYEANYELAPEHFHIDVNDLDATQYRGETDILIGGSPCQSFSLAGLRKGTEDHRGELIYEYIRVVDECRPEVIVYENVKGIMSIDGGQTIKDFVQALRDIGYHCHYGVVNTKDYGVPQNRERLFLVVFLDDAMYHRFTYAPKVKLEKRLKDVLEDDVDEKYYLSDQRINTIDKSHRGIGFGSEETKVSPCLIAAYYKVPTDGFYVKEPNIDMLGLLDIKGTDQIRRVYGTDGIAATLTTMQGGNQEPKIQVPSATKSGYETATTGDSINLSVPNSKTRRGRVGKQVAQTLDTACNQAVVEPFVFEDRTDGIRLFNDGCCGALRTIDACGDKRIAEQHRIRKLTPRECLRLQDFPDTFVQLSKEYVKSLLDTIKLDIKSEIVIKDDIWEILKSITKQSVMPRDARELQSHSGIALCTISDSRSMVMPIMSLNTQVGQKINVNTVIALLGKVSKECVCDTITLGELTEIHCGLMKDQAKKVSVKMVIGHMGMQKSKQKTDTNTEVELMLQIRSEENLNQEKLFTILTSIRKMIQSQTYGSLNQDLSIVVHMECLKDAELNYTKEDLLSLKMGNIDYVSNSGMYKQAGNSMSVNILEMIFNQIEKAKVGECRNSLLDFIGETA